MGSSGEPDSSPNHKFVVVNGVDRGRGYQGYTAVNYFLTEDKCAPEEAKEKCREVLTNLGYTLCTPIMPKSSNE